MNLNDAITEALWSAFREQVCVDREANRICDTSDHEFNMHTIAQHVIEKLQLEEERTQSAEMVGDVPCTCRYKSFVVTDELLHDGDCEYQRGTFVFPIKHRYATPWDIPGDVAWVDRMRPMLGKQVRVTINRDPDHVVTGKLMSFTEDGEVCLLEEDGMLRWSWPNLLTEPA